MSAPRVDVTGARSLSHCFGGPAILVAQDPWLCVPELLRVCLFDYLSHMSNSKFYCVWQMYIGFGILSRELF